jgi:hypothetical protein
VKDVRPTWIGASSTVSAPGYVGRAPVADRQFRDRPGHLLGQAEVTIEQAAEGEPRFLQIDQIARVIDVFVGIEVGVTDLGLDPKRPGSRT